MFAIAVPALVAATASSATATPQAAALTGAATRLEIGRFGTVRLFRPAGTPTSVTLLISDGAGWDDHARSLATVLADHDSVVAGIDGRRYLDAVDHTGDGCLYLGGEFEDLSHAIQQRLRLADYLLPVLAGQGDGATLAALVLEQSPQGTYAGLLSLAFHPELALQVPPCDAGALHWQPRPARTAAAAAGTAQSSIELQPSSARRATPWVMLQDAHDPRFPPEAAQRYATASTATTLVTLPDPDPNHAALDAAWLAAQQSLAASGVAQRPTPAALRDLPLHEVPVSGAAPPDRDCYAVLLTGDGGWAGLDQEVAAALARHDVPVVALNSLRYFWRRRDPQRAAQDLQRIVTRYGAAWRRHGVLLIGYSFGADVLPFLYRRLPANLRAAVRSVTLLAPAQRADFEFHLADWLPGRATAGQPTQPEIERMGDARVLCLRPLEDSESPCDGAHLPGLTTQALAGGHHFGGDYAALATRILDYARMGAPGS